MKIAVLMSTYNGEKYLEEQIVSILMQQCEAQVQLIVRDDGSKDTTPEILQRYADQGKLIWYKGENLKPAKSFLNLIQHCPGYTYYAFADQDDHWYPEKLQQGISALKDKTGPAMYFANARLVDSGLHDLGRNAYKRKPQCDFYSLVVGANILGCTCIFNETLAQLIRQIQTPEKIIMHDYYLAVMCTLHDGEIVYDECARMDYRQHGNNVVGTNWKKCDALRDRIHRITTQTKISIADQAGSILAVCQAIPDERKRSFLEKVSLYRGSIIRTVALACSRQPQFNGKSMEVSIRLAILLRNY